MVIWLLSATFGSGRLTSFSGFLNTYFCETKRYLGTIDIDITPAGSSLGQPFTFALTLYERHDQQPNLVQYQVHSLALLVAYYLK